MGSTMNRFLIGPVFHITERRGPASARRDTMTLAGSMRLRVWALVALGATAVVARADDFNDYPTVARSEYVFGCLKANGETRQAIDQCSCSIDVHRVAAALRSICHSRNRAEHGAGTGKSWWTIPLLRAGKQARLNDLRRAQAEAEVRCF